MYLCNFRSSNSEVATCSSLLRPLSNATSLSQIGFSKEELCTISQDDLIIDLSRRAKLYEVPRVQFLIVGSEKDTQETTVRPLSGPSYEISV